MESTEKENHTVPDREAQDGGVTDRPPLHDVINRTHTGIPIPVNRCKIPVPHNLKSTKTSSLKPPATYKGTALQTKKVTKDHGISASQQPVIKKTVLRKSLLCRKTSPQKTFKSTGRDEKGQQAVCERKDEKAACDIGANKRATSEMVSDSLPEHEATGASTQPSPPPTDVASVEICPPSISTHENSIHLKSATKQIHTALPRESTNKNPQSQPYSKNHNLHESDGEELSRKCVRPHPRYPTPGTELPSSVINPQTYQCQRPTAVEEKFPPHFSIQNITMPAKPIVPQTKLHSSNPKSQTGLPQRPATSEEKLPTQSSAPFAIEISTKPDDRTLKSLSQSQLTTSPSLETLSAIRHMANQDIPPIIVATSPDDGQPSQRSGDCSPSSSTMPEKELSLGPSSNHVRVQSPPNESTLGTKQRSTTPDNLLFSSATSQWRDSSLFPVIHPAVDLPLYHNDCTPAKCPKSGEQSGKQSGDQSPESCTRVCNNPVPACDRSRPSVPRSSKLILKPPTLIWKGNTCTSGLLTSTAVKAFTEEPENILSDSDPGDHSVDTNPKPNPFVMSLPVAMSNYKLQNSDTANGPANDDNFQALASKDKLDPNLSECVCTCLEKLKAKGNFVISTQEYETLKHTAEVARKSMVQLEMLYETTWTELMSATTQVSELAGKVAATQQEKSRLIMELEELIGRVEDYEVDRQMGFAELQCLTSALEKENGRIKELLDQKRSLEELLDESHHKYELLVHNLESTIQKQQCSLDYRIHELEEQKTTIEQLSAQLEQMESIKENMEFLEAEHTTLADSHGDLVMRLQSTEKELATCKIVLLDKDALCNQLQGRIAVLEESLELMEEELEQTCGTVRVLKQQNQEIGRCRSSVHTLSQEMRELLKNLLSKAGMKVSIDVVRDFGRKVNQPWMQSLVASVLQAVGSPDEEFCPKGDNQNSTVADSNIIDKDGKAVDCKSPSEELVDNNPVLSSISDIIPDRVTSPATKSRQNLGSLAYCSAFKPIPSRTNDPTSAVMNEPNHAYLHEPKTNCSDSLLKNPSVMPMSHTEGVQSNCGDEGRDLLSGEVAHLSVVLKEIVRISQVLEKAAYLSIQDLKNDKGSIQGETEQLRGQYQTQKEELEKLQSEMKDCKSTIRELQTEKQIMMQQQEQMLEKLESKFNESAVVNSVAAVENRFYKDALQLQKTIYILKEQLSQKDTEIEDLNETASRRMKVLAENWRKADREVGDLDKLLENTRQVLHRNKAMFRTSEPLNDLLKELDGVCEGDDPIKPLEPIKTAAW